MPWKFTPEIPLSLSLTFERDSAIGVALRLRFSPPYAHRRAPGLLRSKSFTSAARLDRSPEIVVHRTCVELRGAARAALGGVRLHDLEVAYFGFINNACAGA